MLRQLSLRYALSGCANKLLRNVCCSCHHHLVPPASSYVYSTLASPRAAFSHASLFLNKILRPFSTFDSAGSEIVPHATGGDDDVSGKVYNTMLEYLKSVDKMEDALSKLCLEVRLTTALVVEVLERLCFEEEVAFWFFTWAGRQENYSHDNKVYDVMMDILSNTKYNVEQFRIVRQLLEYKRRHAKSSVPVEVLLPILRNYTEKHLEQFEKKKNIRVKMQPEIYAFNLLLEALCKCYLVEDADQMLLKVKSKLKPNSYTYNILFFGWCRVMNPKRAMTVMKDMIKMGYKPDKFAYNTAIDTFCRAGMLTEAAELLEFMKTNGSTTSSPTAQTYATMIIAFAKNDRMEECFETLSDMIRSGSLPDVSTYKALIEGMCFSDKTEAAYKFLEEMGKMGYPPDIVTYNLFLKVLCDDKNRDGALRLYEKMLEVGCMPSVQTYNILIEMYFGMGDPDGAFDVWAKIDKLGCSRGVETYCLMIEGLFRCGNTKDASLLVDEVINRGMKLPYTKFDIILKQISTCGDLNAIHRLSEHMRRFYDPAMARHLALTRERKSRIFSGK